MNRKSTRTERALNAKKDKLIRSVFGKGRCMHPAAPDSCSKGFAKSHTVAQVHLRGIAEGGHVVSFQSRSSVSLLDAGKMDRARLIGVRRASTFPIFCPQHDNELFAAIETGAALNSSDHFLRLAYRAFAREAWLKQRTLDMHRRAPPAIADHLDDLAFWTQKGLPCVQKRLSSLGDALATGDHSGWRTETFPLRGPVNFVGSGAYTPWYDFAMKQVQLSGKVGYDVETLALSVVPQGPGESVVALTWFAEDLGMARFVGSFEAVGVSPKVVLPFLLKALENVYLRPSFWQSQTEHVQSLLIDCVEVGLDGTHRKDELVVDALELALA